MRSLHLLMITLALGLALEAPAQSQRTFVSAGSGNDLYPCTRTQPCRNFSAAAAAASASGEVIVLDSGGYGSFTITKSLAVIAPSGVYAGVTGFSGSTITVDATAAGKVVVRGLTVHGLGGADGLSVLTGDVFVESCSFSNLTDDGVHVVSGGAATILKSSAYENANNGFYIQSNAAMAITRAAILECTSNHNLVGMWASNGSRVTITDSVASQNQGGIDSCCADAKVWITRTTSSNNVAEGIGVGSGAEAYVAGCTVTGNATGLYQSSVGTLFTMQNNTVRANGTDVSGIPSIFTPL
jgi:parallel beta helix pectate lyase-like protein